MKTLHVTFSYPPDPPGGTELYVGALCRALEAQGGDAIVAAPGPKNERYAHGGLSVRRFVTQAHLANINAIYGVGDAAAADAFDDILSEERPDLVHQHALTPACSVRLVQRAKQRGLPVVFTYHTPTTTCQRGTLLEWGSTPCDGRLDVERCTACTLHGLGLGRAASSTLARVPGQGGRLIGSLGLAGGAWTALRMSSLMRERHDASRLLFTSVDAFVALTPWVEELLVANGVPRKRIVRVPHGIAFEPRAPRPVRPSGRLRLAHLGRVDPVKGTRLLIEAMRLVPDAPIDLDVFGVVQHHAGADLLEGLRTLASGDPRVRFLPSLDHGTVIERLAEYDMLAVPSQWMETGPLVVLEAFAAGVPVLGSALGGIADKVANRVDGLLVRPHDSVQAWGQALAECAGTPGLVADLTRGVLEPRSVADVAGDMLALYTDLTLPGAGASRAAGGADLQDVRRVGV
jgi:glycosyltransferase involved in cell wall biosynthesis